MTDFISKVSDPNVLHRKVLADIIPLIQSNRPAIQKVARDTESLRGLYPEVDDTKSFLESIESTGTEEPTLSVISERQFEFDDDVTNSQAYRRVVVAATRTLKESHGRNTSVDDKSRSLGAKDKQDSTLVPHEANQSRKISTATQSKSLEASAPEEVLLNSNIRPIATLDPNNFVQQLRGYVNHVDDIEQKLLRATAEIEQLHTEMEKVRHENIANLEKLRTAEEEKAYIISKFKSDHATWENTVSKYKSSLEQTQEALVITTTERDRFHERFLEAKAQTREYIERFEEALQNGYFNERELRKQRVVLAQSILEGMTVEIESTLLIPLHPPTGMDDIQRPPLFQAYKFPSAPQGWSSIWNS